MFDELGLALFFFDPLQVYARTLSRLGVMIPLQSEASGRLGAESWTRCRGGIRLCRCALHPAHAEFCGTTAIKGGSHA